MGKDLVIPDSDKRILSEIQHEDYFEYKDNCVVRKTRDFFLEKVLEIRYWDGFRNRKGWIRKLNTVVDKSGTTLRQKISRDLSSSNSRIAFTYRTKGKDGKIDERLVYVRSSNIISCEEIWVKADKELFEK